MHRRWDRSRALICAPDTRILPVLDPFRLNRTQILCRARFLRGLGFRQLVLASTDDAGYARIVPGLIKAIVAQTGMRIVEHFRPTRNSGFRGQQQTHLVLMSQVPSSRDAHFRLCARLNGAAANPIGRGLRCLALPVGHDPKSSTFVNAAELGEDDIAVALGNLNRIGRAEVVYLFCRQSRLRAETVAKARKLIGYRPLLVASGNVRTSDDVCELLGAGAGAVAVGSLFETMDWRARFEALLVPSAANRKEATGLAGCSQTNVKTC